MCLYPRFIKNKKYLPNAKNNGNPPALNDIRTLLVPIGCGNCIECRKQKSNEWRTRLLEELKIWKYKYFVTLTFSEENMAKCEKGANSTAPNVVAAYAVRHFCERWRKIHKKSIRHWLITELGHEGTERLHLHGIIFSNDEIDNTKLERFWSYGYTDTGQYCNERSINYIVKYVTKIDSDHKGYIPYIFCSAGIGANYINSNTLKKHIFNNNDTNEKYTLNNGRDVALPIYYRNKLFTEEEREKLWLHKLDEETIYCMGIKFDISNEEGFNEYLRVKDAQQKRNIEMGYGDLSAEWKRKEYNTTLRKLNAKSKLQNARKTTDKLI